MITALVRGNIAVLRASRGMDVLYVPGVRGGLTCTLTAVVFRLTGRRVLHHFHDLGTDALGARFWFHLPTDFVHHTKFGYESITTCVPSLRRKRNFIVAPVLEVPPARQLNREDQRLLEGKRNLFFIGQVSRHKGVDILLQGFELIAREYPDVDLHLVGGCSDEFRGELDQQLSFASLAHRVHFWGFREDALQLLRHAYLYVHSSPPTRFNESFGRSVVEAMALGVPTVCFRSGALQEIVVHEETGLICDESAGDLAKGMKRMLNDARLRDQCSANSSKHYDKFYCPRAVLDRWQYVFSSPTRTALSSFRSRHSELRQV